MKRMIKKGIEKNLKRNLAAGVVLIMILALSVTGVTHAWFTGTSNTLVNIFNVGTVIIEASDISVEDSGNGADIITPGEPLEKTYKITNTGTKSIYVRALFEGYWEKIFHRNTASVTAMYGSATVSDSDMAHFKFEGQEPDWDLNNGSSAGFTASDYSLSPATIKIGSPSTNGGGTGTAPATGSSVIYTSTVLTGYPDPCEGPKVEPITETEVENQNLDYFENQNPPDKNPAWPDPNPAKLPAPGDCDLIYFKIDRNQGQIDDGQTFTDNGFEVTIYKKQIDEKYYFAFQSNYPVYHVYAKGGNEGGNLYRYYFPEENPDYPEGVYNDCRLSQPGGDWSHIAFYYCEKPPEPDITIQKQVSVDGGSTWQNAGEAPGPQLVSPNLPWFRFIVTNTGNVTLTGIVVEDDVLDLAPDNPDTDKWTIPSLAPGGSATLDIEYSTWNERLNTDNIKIEVCSENWVPTGQQDLGTYFYHTEVIRAENGGEYEVTLCVKVHFTGDFDYYEDAEFKLYSFFEAVQASNNMIYENWPADDLGWLE